MRGLVDRQPARERPPSRGQLLLGSEPEGASDLVAAGLLLTRELELGGTAAQALEEAGAEAGANPLACRQPGVRLAEAAPAAVAAKAALAPDERHPTSRQRQIAHAYARPLLDLHLPTPTQAAAARYVDQLEFEHELVRLFAHRDHGESFQAEHSVKLLEHPLSLLAPRFTDHAERRGGSGCLAPSPHPRCFSKSPKV
ncbi:MAG TPA: hypothetical protein VE055_04810 [Gaiellaceae bacterium]|nr:hypothetical protein [Gaiellaceae bacterium]